MGILAAAAFAVRYTYHTTKGKSPGQIVFGQDTIIPINHVAGWMYKRQRKQVQIDKDIIRENYTRINNDYRLEDKVMKIIKLAYRY